MWIETNLVVTDTNRYFPDGSGVGFEDLDEFWARVSEVYDTCARCDTWWDNQARVWDTDEGPILARGVEFIELDEDDLAQGVGRQVEAIVRSLTSPSVHPSYRSVPVYGPGGELLRHVLLDGCEEFERATA